MYIKKTFDETFRRKILQMWSMWLCNRYWIKHFSFGPNSWSKLLYDPLIQHWKSTWIGIWRYIWENFSAIYAITIHIVNHPLMPTWGKSIPWKGRSNVTNAILPLLWKRIWQNISAKVMAKKSSNAISVIMLQVKDQIIFVFFILRVCVTCLAEWVIQPT